MWFSKKYLDTEVSERSKTWLVRSSATVLFYFYISGIIQEINATYKSAGYKDSINELVLSRYKSTDWRKGLDFVGLYVYVTDDYMQKNLEKMFTLRSFRPLQLEILAGGKIWVSWRRHILLFIKWRPHLSRTSSKYKKYMRKLRKLCVVFPL